MWTLLALGFGVMLGFGIGLLVGRRNPAIADAAATAANTVKADASAAAANATAPKS